MDLSLTRLNRGQITVDGEFLNFNISDEGFNQRLMNLTGHPKSGDYVVHLRIKEENGGISERLYCIESRFTYKFLNRITLQKSLQNILRVYGIEVVNAGLYYKTFNAAYVHNTVVSIDTNASNDQELHVKGLRAA